MTTDLEPAIQRITRALLDECRPVELHELGGTLGAAPRDDVTRHRRRFLVIGLVAAGAMVATVALTSSRTSSDTVIVGTPSETMAPDSSTTVTSSPATTVAMRDSIGPNDEGADVRALQQRLVDLRFDPGPVDGYFGDATRAALWAYQKLVLDLPPEQATGSMTGATWAEMQADPRIEPRRPGIDGSHVEIDLARQVLVVFDGDEPILITHMSSGDGQPWVENVTIDPNTVENPGAEPITKVVAGDGVTPGGVFSIGRRYEDGDGWRTDALGRMYKPIYFDDGIAIHGSSNVPNQPASHGAVRIPMHIAEYFGELVDEGDPVYVFDGVREPEFSGGGGPPPFDAGTITGDAVAMPDLAGLTLEDALAALDAVGLSATVREFTLPADDLRIGRVVGLSPMAGTPVTPGSELQITIGSVAG